MKKANLKTMVLAAAMAAFMAYAPVMAEEADEIIEEPFEAAETVVEEIKAEIPVAMIEVAGVETIAEAEVPEQAAQAAAVAETEENAEVKETEALAETEETEALAEAEETEEVQTEAAEPMAFLFENDEVIVRAEAFVELPENVEMQVSKIEKGSAEYEAAKQAVAASCGTDEDAEYSFYSVSFMADGAEVELEDGSVNVQIEFKTVQKDSAAESQEVVKIGENGVDNVTAETEEGANMSSVNFAM